MLAGGSLADRRAAAEGGDPGNGDGGAPPAVLTRPADGDGLERPVRPGGAEGQQPDPGHETVARAEARVGDRVEGVAPEVGDRAVERGVAGEAETLTSSEAGSRSDQPAATSCSTTGVIFDRIGVGERSRWQEASGTL